MGSHIQSEYLEAVALGAIQAITEFLPISSSAHLLVAGQLLGGGASSRSFDVGLHLGTVVALCTVFWRDWLSIVGAMASNVASHHLRVRRWSADGRIGLLVAWGCLPIVLAGPLIAKRVEDLVRTPSSAAVFLIVFGIVLGHADRVGRSGLVLTRMGWGQAALIGVAQAIALIPGVSRSGVTMSAARYLGFSRAQAARFSFYLGAPAIVGAAVFSGVELMLGEEKLALGPAAVGLLSAGAIGVVVIRWLLRYLVTGTLAPFVLYRLALGVVILAPALVD